ncbi:thermonuclease family protein [Cylindrospermopsis raciborskii]|uniref:Nuclease n=1 Tax=Cylindrospermopsis raciborskii CENA302 TaxID=1170768 RepID=A0A9Q5QZY8_9CYAN|nr:thermonuclease family protein [Cylindrospermopsis raciborskii]MCZ2202435.1 thermonuclease family protein [Cylindrospermopsis raciborskii PAMP2012]MCZ2206974.1 thermonuclease family protein [Cylindrospermopsis raciborskii PAMP2011]NLQ04669.1 thermonuclease family protein [Cylindrospermopsis raciborskii MVCC19]OHY32957.1 nuclease [Cylindrospermopsis raciborskii MVCC14]OPH11239.1 nuclease [Cylindrospermopsis raciborskii CENA302]
MTIRGNSCNYLSLLPMALCCLLMLLLVGCQSRDKIKDSIVQARVVRVVSGQTVEVVKIGEPTSLVSSVRLIGLEAPDLRQYPWGEDARKLLEKLIQDANSDNTSNNNTNSAQIKLEFDLQTQDKFGRNLAYVWKDQVLVNEQIIKQGYALFAGRSPNHKYDLRLENAQHWARLMGEGIWNPENPLRLAPGQFRRING